MSDLVQIGESNASRRSTTAEPSEVKLASQVGGVGSNCLLFRAPVASEERFQTIEPERMA